MRSSPLLYAYALAIVAGCGGELPRPADPLTPLEPVAVAPQPTPQPPPVPPKPEFDPNDRERTYKWIREEMVPLQAKYRPAKEAIDENPLNDDAMKEFLAELPAFKSKVAGIAGREVAWRVKVHSINQNGVVIDGEGNEYTEPFNGKELGHFYVNLFIENGKVDREQFTEQRTLRLNRQITREFAKTLKAGDQIVVHGKIKSFVFLYGDDKPPPFIEITLDEVQADSTVEPIRAEERR